MKQSSSYLGLYRAGLSTPEHRKYITVAREQILEDAVEHLRASAKKKSKHHFLFIGPRGIGKTHLLSLVEDAVAADPELAASYVVVRFPEESNRVLSFADFLLVLCEILRERLPEERMWAELHQQVAEQEDNTVIVDTLVPALRTQNRQRKRTLLVMLENLNTLFESQLRNKTDIAALRKFFMDDNGCLLMATAPMHFGGITNIKDPFFDFFDTQVLDDLDKEQAIGLIRRNLEWDNQKKLLGEFDSLRPKLLALHTMTGGSPRLILMLYELIAHDNVVKVKEQFLQLLDRITPFYQDRLRDVAPQERAVLETLATMRDQPKTPAAIAAKMRMSQAQTSALLKRLADARYLASFQNPEDKRSRLYVIREGLFDLWLYMNLTRGARGRLPVMVEWVAQFYTQTEDREKKRREFREKYTESDGNAREGLDLLSEVGTPEERAVAKLDLAGRQLCAEDARAYLEEARRLKLDPMGTWIINRAGDAPAVNYLDEMQDMIECWTLHRAGNAEAFVERLARMSESLNFKNYSEVKVSFLRDHLSEITDDQGRIWLRCRLGKLLMEMARWAEAEDELRRACREVEGLVDQKWSSVALNNLAQLLKATNRLTEAEILMRQVLAIDEASLSTRHPKFARNLSNLAQLLHATNRLTEAEPLMRRALAITQAALGEQHPDVAVDFNNLAGLLQATNRLAEAEPLMRRALTIAEASLGDGHPDVAVYLNNLGGLLLDTNRLAEAEPLIRRALAIDQASFGREHPNVARDLNNLAELLRVTDRLSEAEPLMRQALSIDEASFGKEHPKVAIRLNNLAGVLRATSRLTEAEVLLRRALSIDRGALGEDHPDVATDLNNLASLLQTTHRLSEAEPLMRQALSIDEASFGGDHPNVARDLNNLGLLLQDTNRLTEAEPVMQRAFGIVVASLGADHPNILTVKENYVSLLEAMNVPKDEIERRVSET